jgi:prepilin-type N-terminal cleavage/methylation domain-containing protein
MIRKRNRGVTLIEVMAALVIALVIAIGVMSYQYACAQHARMTDVRVTGSRIGLLFLENWVAVGGIDDVGIYNPIDRLGFLDPEPPIPPGNIVSDVDLSGVPGLGTTFRSYGVFTNGTWFWIKMSYDEEIGVDNSIRELGVSIAWSLDYGSPTLEFDSGSPFDLQRLVRFSKSVIYVPPNTGT